MPGFFTLLLLALAVHYALVLGLFAVGLVRVLRAPRVGSAPLPRASVIVAARNEAGSIGDCLDRLLASDYPAHLLEVIVVDDGSTDATASIVADRLAAAQRVPVANAVDASLEAEPPAVGLRLLQTSGNGAGKAVALAEGIAAAAGEVILTTDADCTVGPRWVRTMVNALTPDTAFVSGPVLYRAGPSAFERMQALEFLGLVAVGAGAIGIGRPNLCNGANVAYRREIYDQLGALDADKPIGPGQDEVLIQRIAQETTWRVRFCADPEAVVTTTPVSTVGAFLEQRRRWARMTRHYPTPALIVMMTALFAFFVTLLAGLLSWPFLPQVLPALGLAFAVKMAAEAAILVPACRHFGLTALLRYLFVAQLPHVVYLVVAVVAGLFGNTPWKGRRIG